MADSWARQHGEPALWHARFVIYRDLGPDRTIEAAYRVAAEREGLRSARPGSGWYGAARDWSWEERAAEWDTARRELLRALESERQFDARERRLRMIDVLLSEVFAALEVARLSELDPEQAREWAPTLRMMFRDLLTAQRAELGLPDVTPAELAGAMPFTADELAQAAAELEEIETPDDPGTLLVAVSKQAAYAVDLAALRAVREETGVGFHRLIECSSGDLDIYLRRERYHGRPVRWLYLVADGTPNGIEFVDQVVSGQWLSERLTDVEVALIAGMFADRVADWLPAVPHVVSLDVDLPGEDAAALARHFWAGVVQGAEVDVALERALARCPAHVGESVIRHW